MPTHPKYDLVIATLDTNQSQKEENDWNAFVVMGTFAREGRTNAMLAMARRSRLELNVQALTEDERREMWIDRVDLTAWERGEILGGRELPVRPPPPERGEIRRALHSDGAGAGAGKSALWDWSTRSPPIARATRSTGC